MPMKCPVSQYSLLLSTLFYWPPAGAHHTLINEFDVQTVFELRGSITRMEWGFPHIWFYLEVIDEDGEPQEWACELASPDQLRRAGWEEKDLPPGTMIRALAHPARDGSHTCASRNIYFDDGEPIIARDAFKEDG